MLVLLLQLFFEIEIGALPTVGVVVPILLAARAAGAALNGAVVFVPPVFNKPTSFTSSLQWLRLLSLIL
jgi:hypothetical protein